MAEPTNMSNRSFNFTSRGISIDKFNKDTKHVRDVSNTKEIQLSNSLGFDDYIKREITPVKTPS